MAKFKKEYSKKIDYSGVKEAERLYKEYKKSFSKNHRRDIKNICETIFQGIDDTPENNQIKEIIQKDIKNFRYHKNLSEINEKAQILPHDRNTKYLLPCNTKYLLDILKMAKAYLENRKYKKRTKEMKHIKSCSICASCYNSLINSIEYRRDHLEGREQLFFQRNPHNEKYENKNKKETEKLKRELVSKYEKKQNENTEGNKEMIEKTEMIDYEITVGCICGNINKYNFNHIRIKEIPFGRQDKEGNYSYINVCEDDKPYLSRTQCYFKYDGRKKDWYIKAEAKKRKHIYYITKEKMKKLLAKKEPRTVNKEKLKCQNILAKAFKRLGSDKIYLSDIDLLCFIPTPLSFNKEKKDGIFHPVLGNLPYGWYIDIVDRREFKDSVKSYIKRTMVNRNTTIVSTRKPKKTKVRK